MLFGEKRAENVRQLSSSQERIPNIYTHAHANTHTNTVGRASVEYVRPFWRGCGVGNRAAIFIFFWKVYVKAAVLEFWSSIARQVWIWPGKEVKY